MNLMICKKCNEKVKFNTLTARDQWVSHYSNICYYCRTGELMND